MGKGPRVVYPGAYLHVMNHSTQSLPLFKTKREYLIFLDLLERKTNTYSIDLFAYCLMGNHYHLFFHTPTGEVSLFIGSLQSAFSQKINRIRGKAGPLFQKGFTSIIVDKNSYLIELTRYIHLNPVRAGLAKRPEEYPWSSIHAYINPSECKWINVETVLDYFDGSIKSYLEFLHEPLEVEEKIKPLGFNGAKFYGNKSFARRAFGKYERRKTTQEERKYQKIIRGNIPYPKVIDTVLREFDKKELSQINSRSFESTLIKKLLAYFLFNYTLLTTKEIADLLGYRFKTGVSMAVKRVDTELKNAGEITQFVDKIKRKLKSEL